MKYLYGIYHEGINLQCSSFHCIATCIQVFVISVAQNDLWAFYVSLKPYNNWNIISGLLGLHMDYIPANK